MELQILLKRVNAWLCATNKYHRRSVCSIEQVIWESLITSFVELKTHIERQIHSNIVSIDDIGLFALRERLNGKISLAINIFVRLKGSNCKEARFLDGITFKMFKTFCLSKI